ncbi:Slc22a13, partial [Symbiodinium microadriaticum]
MFVAGTAWLLLTSSGWRVLTFVTAIPVTVSLVGSVFVLPESPRWLLIQGRTKEAEEVMRAAAAYNGTDLPPFTLAPEKEEHHGVPIWEFLKPEQRGLSMPLWTVWLCFG